MFYYKSHRKLLKYANKRTEILRIWDKYAYINSMKPWHWPFGIARCCTPVKLYPIKLIDWIVHRFPVLSGSDLIQLMMTTGTNSHVILIDMC